MHIAAIADASGSEALLTEECSLCIVNGKKEEACMEFATLAQTFEQLEQTSFRLKLVELLTDLFRSIERPEEIQQICYLGYCKRYGSV